LFGLQTEQTVKRKQQRRKNRNQNLENPVSGKYISFTGRKGEKRRGEGKVEGREVKRGEGKRGEGRGEGRRGASPALTVATHNAYPLHSVTHEVQWQLDLEHLASPSAPLLPWETGL
jgi:hypothetical protein